MLRAQRMAALSQRLALLIRSLTLPEDVTLAVDIDPMDLAKVQRRKNPRAIEKQ